MKQLPRRAFAQQALALAALATVPALHAQASTEFADVPASLFLQNVPPVPKALAAKMAAYTEFRGHSFSDWHPTRAEMLVSHRAAGASTVSAASLEPKRHSNASVFRRAPPQLSQGV